MLFNSTSSSFSTIVDGVANNGFNQWTRDKRQRPTGAAGVGPDCSERRAIAIPLRWRFQHAGEQGDVEEHSQKEDMMILKAMRS